MPTLLLLAAAALSGPSFTCQPGQTPVETAICASPALSAADREMAALYAVTRDSAFGKGPSNELVAQRDALKAMRGCAGQSGAAAITTCVQASYATRNTELAIAAALRAPDLALPVLRRLDPVFAPIVEAIAVWASEPAESNWSAPARAAKRQRILAALAPTMTRLLTDDSESFARDILADPVGDGIAVKKLDDVLLSDRHFAEFLDVIGPALGEAPGSGGRAIPCAAVVGHPALLQATASIYGSTMDSGVLNSNCEATLPPTPALSALDAKLRGAWPNCDGTIRFAAYRTYNVAVDAARLGFVTHDPKATRERRHGVTAAQVAAAQSELANYYGSYLGKSPAQAQALAADAITAVLGVAQECD